MGMRRLIVLLLGGAVLVLLGTLDARAEAALQDPPDGCSPLPRFAALDASMPEAVGGCVGEAREDPTTGDLVQLTARGALIWRRLDDMALFTDGLALWSDRPALAGPYPLAEALSLLEAPGAAAALPDSGPVALPAADFQVNSSEDAGDAAPGDGVCATIIGACTVRAAIMEANATAGLARVVVPAGVYKLGIEGPGEDAAVSGDLDVTDDLDLIGEGPGETFLQGAGLDRVLDIHPAARVTVRGLRVRRGTVWGEGGAGIRNAGLLTLVDANVSSNKAFAGRGGGILTTPGSATVLVRTSVWHNKATSEAGEGGGDGGGIDNHGLLWLLNATLANNRADGGTGGGLHTRGLAIVTSSTVAANGAAAGGGIRNAGGVVQLLNTTLAGSLQGSDCAGVVVSRGHNLIEQPDGCELVGDLTGILLGRDPLMDELIEDGPRAGSRDLLPESPVVDAGTNDACPDSDLRGAPRPRDGRGTGQATCDIGAVEYQPE